MTMKSHLASIIKRPHITEKATMSAEKNMYVFEVAPKANKKEIARAVTEQYKVVPVKISTVTIPAKNTFVRGKRGVSSGYKKAYVYVKKGEKIEIV